MSSTMKIIAAFLVAAATVATVKMAYALAIVLAFEARSPLNDYLIYTTVGRGILNGFTPYVDLFESKPPGVFLLAALSLAVTGNERLAMLLDVGFLLFFPVGLALFSLHQPRPRKYMHRALIACLAFCLGTLLVLYIDEHRGSYQTELFGALFASLYLGTLVGNLPEQKWLTILRGLLLLATVGLKESLLPATMAAALIVCRDSGQFIRAYLVPLGLAVAGGIAFLALAGWLGPYLHIYLPAMLQYRITVGADPPLFRGLLIRRVFVHLTTYATAPLFGYVLALLWACSAYFKCPAQSVKTLLLSVGNAGAGVLVLHFTYVLIKLVVLAGFRIALADMFFLGFLAGYLLLTGGATILLWRSWKTERTIFWHSTFGLVALYLMSLAVALGEYNDYHFAVAFPCYAALILLFLQHVHSERPNKAVLALVASLTLIAAILFQFKPIHLILLGNELAYSSTAKKELVTQVDALLDDCKIDRYYGVGVLDDLAFARHSPIGPLPALGYHLGYLGVHHPLVEQTVSNLVNVAPVIIMKTNVQLDPVGRALFDAVKGQFTAVPLPCARSHIPIEGYDVLFRSPS